MKLVTAFFSLLVIPHLFAAFDGEKPATRHVSHWSSLAEEKTTASQEK